MPEDHLDEEFSIMYKESERVKMLDSNTFRLPLKSLKVPRAVTLEAGSSLQDALTLMQLKQFGCVLITKEDKLAGILTERDIMAKALGENVHFGEILVDDIMTPNPESFQPNDSIAFAMNVMSVGGYRHVPIVDEHNIPLAIISVKDVINFIVEHFPEELLNLPPKPTRRTRTQDGG
ncbi:MAG: CBS domain-containing protein [Bacteroidota bacterium]|jgi:CBS domain-containing protein